MRKTSLLISAAALLLGAGTATAAEDYTCATPPTCASLGYTDTVANCSGKKMLRCPFDTSKVFCSGDCVSEGYTHGGPAGSLLNQGCLLGQKIVSCPYDSQYYKCTGEATSVEKSCEALGYKKAATSGFVACLNGSTKVLCPSDSGYYKCEVDCPAAGFTKSCGSTGCKGTCLSGQTAVSCPADTKYYKCTTSTTTTDKCSSGFLSSDMTQACACQYGLKENGTKSTKGNTCYRCGTYDECGGSNGIYCMKCNKIDNGDMIVTQEP